MIVCFFCFLRTISFSFLIILSLRYILLITDTAELVSVEMLPSTGQLFTVSF